MKIKGIDIKVTEEQGIKRVQLTKRLPNGKTYTRWVNEDEGEEITVFIDSFIKDADKKYNEVKAKM